MYFQPEVEKPDPSKELEDEVSQSDFFSELTPQDVKEVVESVTKEILGSLQVRLLICWILYIEICLIDMFQVI